MSIPRIEPYDLPSITELPTNRLELGFEPRRAALLIHDAQEYFLDFFGSNNDTIIRVIENIASLRAACSREGVPTVFSAQPPVQSRQDRGLLEDMWGPGITAHPDRANLCHQVQPHEGDLILTKGRYSAFVGTPLASWLSEKGRTQLIICGVYAHIGCQCTAAEAFMTDITPIMVSDAVADFSRSKHLNALEFVADCCGLVHDTQYVLNELDGTPSLDQRSHRKLPSLQHELRTDVSRILAVGPESLAFNTSLFDAGLDSVRFMTLIEQWRSKGYSADMMELAEIPTISAWAELFKRNNTTL